MNTNPPTQEPKPVPRLNKEQKAKLLMLIEQLRVEDPTNPKIEHFLKILRAQSQYGMADLLPGTVSSSAAPSFGTSAPPSRVTSSISQNQLLQLKAQILAYKYLVRNLALPPKLLTAIRNFNILKSSQNKPPVQISNTPVLSVAPKHSPQVTSPPPLVESKPILSAPVANINAVVMPDKLPLAYIYQEREKRIKIRMAGRLEELNSMSPDLPENLKRQALIEMKQLKMLDLQKKLRADIVHHMRKAAEFEATSDFAAFKRTKKVKDVKPTLEKATKSQAKEMRVEKHKEFLAALQKHWNDFRQFHTTVQKRKKKIARDILNYHSNEERKKELQEQRKQRELLEALRQQDEEAYMKLLEDTKNTRLSLLLKQTDEYLEKISEMVKGQKDRDEIAEKKKELKEKTKGKGVGRGKKKEKDKDEKEGEKEGEKEEEKETEGKLEITEGSTTVQHVIAQNKRYYATAHSIEEKTQQPEMLVGGKLKSFQLVGLQWLVSLYNNNLNGILADEMGLGKTIQTISLISYLMEKKNDNGPYLICVPLGTMTNWAMEFSRWAPSIHVVIYKGKPPARRQIYKEEVVGGKYNVLLTSYEYVMIDKSDLGKVEWNYIIIDEGHRIKNRNSKLSSTLRQYMSRHRLLLTGTPLQNDLGELWSLLNFLLPNIFNSAENFQQWFNSPFAYAKGKKKENPDFIAPNEEETLLIINRLHKVLRPFLLRRLKRDVEHDLPDKIECILKCELSALQKRMYKHMVERGMMLCDPDDPKGRKNKGFNNTLMQLQKICNHPYLFRDEYEIDNSLIRVSGKFDLLDRVLPKLHAAGHRILIFNQMTNLMTIMEEYFAFRGYTNYLRLDGSTKSEDRGTLVAKWNAPDSPYWIFILSTKAGGLGLNLQTADTVVLFDTDWNPHMDLQAQDRVHRIGQQKEVRVFRLVTHNSIEERILERASFKLEVDAKVIQAGMFNTTANDRMRKDMLQALLYEDTDKDEAELITSDEQVNALIARTEEEYQLYQKMDQERQARDDQLWRAQGNAKRPPRLMQEDELPDYLIQDLQDEDITLTYGRGRRERRDVQYEDNLTDFQFAKMLEGEELKKRKKSSEEPEEGRKRRKKEDDDKSKKKKDKPPKNQAVEELNQKFEAIWTRITKEANADGRLLCPIFMKLPSKRDYPDYYRLIKSPICLNQIKAKIDQRKYRSVFDFKLDFETLFSNAQEYNLPGSEVYEDSIQLSKCFERELKLLIPEGGSKPTTDDDSHIDIE